MNTELPNNVPAQPQAPAEATLPAPASAVRPPVVEFRNVGKTYIGDTPFTAIKNVSLRVEDYPERGEFICILGPSGCGKSTVLRLIAGLSPQYPASSGEVHVFGKPVLPASSDRGMVFQDYTSFDHLSVLENIAFGLELRGMAKAERNKLALEWIAKVGLNPTTDAKKYPSQLSGGMRQRVAIARTLILKPRIILMDEPFGALDPSTRLAMQDLLVKLWTEQEASVFFITHSIEEAVYLGDKILIMSKAPGTIVQEINAVRSTRPAAEAQREPEFLKAVFAIRDVMEKF
jgi:NitT/TauT family transport system ATP-binding protein